MPETKNGGAERFRPHKDYEKLQELFPAVRELQKLAKQHGVPDIFQDNGGKILQIALLLGIDLLPGREGNDAVDATTKGELELKTLNFENGGGFTTHHHLNHDILAKYRRVEWIFAAYEGIEIRTIWLLTPSQMEPWFQKWETMLKTRNHINNPKISRAYVATQGKVLYTIPGALESTKPVRNPRKPVIPRAKAARLNTGLLDLPKPQEAVDFMVGNPPYSGRGRKRRD